MLRDLKVLPPLGESDHVGLLVMLNIRTDNRFVKSKIRQWGKIKSSEMISHGNYGNETIKTSRSGYKLLLQANRGTRKHSFFPHRIINYWNKIPDYVKDAESTECFKSRLQSFKQDAILRNCTSGHYWELSEEIITKIEASQINRESYVSYMSDNPNVACRKFISMT